ncbi:PLP-dependent aminotransferase family protein [Ornithinimicrobium tianjinense]|uniref:GntR family transcriptional regulator n=1 Tax=Ornithinimicrobium tianjinense TaxID=1195761 RepID=A0A917BHD2_9MICO|nr:PLP-dependent aminotransferase family protein [Ornithinimicrobium tianjinense]GGF41885.1 GntR family transcriptional regulator [Ornithinimicrobium tianjinense]
MDDQSTFRHAGGMPLALTASRVASLVGQHLEGPGRGEGPAYARLADALRQAIVDGRLPQGTRLPSERDLTGPVGLSRTTVTRAYAELRDQGYVVTRRGSGSLVRVPDVPGGRVDHLLAPSSLDGADVADLTCTAQGAPPGLTEAFERAMADLPAYLPGTGYYPGGLPALRERIAARFTRRGLPTDPEQVLVTAGALAAVATACGPLVRRRAPVLVESPTYPNAVAALQGAGARVVPHPIDHLTHDWDVPGLAAALRASGARTAYLIPDFHNPTGALMSDEQRVQVARVLRAHDVVAVVDESLVDLPLDGQEVPAAPLGRHLPTAVTVGSASKTFWGGLRIGWLRVPRSRVEEFASSRLRLDLGAPVVEQLVLCHLLDRYDEIVAERRASLRAGRDVLLEGLSVQLPDWRVRVPTGGMALWCALPRPGSTRLAVAARRHGVVLAPGPTFAPAGGMDGWVRLPYSLPAAQLAGVAGRLAAAWDDVVRGRVRLEDLGRGVSGDRIIA